MWPLIKKEPDAEQVLEEAVPHEERKGKAVRLTIPSRPATSRLASGNCTGGRAPVQG